MKPVRKVSVFYGHVASNIGDLAINLGEVNLLREAFPEAKLHFVLLDAVKNQNLPSARPTIDGNGEHQVTFFTANYKEALKYQVKPSEFLADCEADDADLIALASGEHLFHYAHGENEKSLFWRMLPALAAKAQEKCCIMLPSTYGPYETDISRELIASVLDIVDGFSTRDILSARLLAAQLGVTEVNSFLDPAFFLKSPGKRTYKHPPSRLLGLTMRSEAWGIRLSKEAKESGVSTFSADNYRSSRAFQFSVAICNDFIGRIGGRVRIFVQTTADETLAGHIQDALCEVGFSNSVEVYRPASVTDYLSAVYEVEAVVASRFHAVVLAMVAGVPAVGVYFDVHGHKMPGLFELLDRQGRCINLSQIPIGDAAENAIAVLNEKREHDQELSRHLEKLKVQNVSWLKNIGSKRVTSRQLLRTIGALGSLAQDLVDDGYLAFSERRVKAFKESANKLSAGKEQADRRVIELHQKLEIAQNEINRIESLEKQVTCKTKLVSQLTSKLETARAEVLRAGKVEEYLREELEVQGRRAADDLETAKEQTTALMHEIEAEKARLHRLRTAACSSAQQLRELEESLERVKTSISFKLGTALVRVAKSPRRIVQLPLEIGALYTSYRNRGKRRASKSPPPQSASRSSEREMISAQELDQLVRIYEEKGAEGIIEKVMTVHLSDRQKQSNSLIEASKHLAAEGYLEAEFDLTNHAVKIHKDDASLRALYWVAQRTGELETALDCIRQYRRLYQTNPSETQRKFLDHVNRGPINQLTVLDFVPAKAERKLTSVPGRICYLLHNSLPYSSGGYATRAQGLAVGLNKAAYETIVVTRPGFPIDTIPELANNDLPLQETIEGITYQRDLSTSRTGRTAVDYMRTAADALMAQFERLRPEVVIGASNYLTALPGLIAARRLGLPFIYEVRGFWEITRISREPEYKQTANFKVQSQLEAETAKRSDHVFTLTGPMKQELSVRGVDPRTITILPNSCESERFTPRARDAELAARLGIPENIPVIGYIGTFVQYEGLELLVEAAARLRERSHIFRLLLVGNENTSGRDVGPITAEINRIASAYGLDQWLIMPGRVPHEEVEAYYSLIDIAPFPRKSQPVSEMVSPMKPLEAFAMEKAVVVSSVAALEEMVEHERTGLIFDKDSVESLTDVLARLIVDPGLRAKLGQEGRRWVETKRTWDATARHAAKVISTITGRGQEEDRVA